MKAAEETVLTIWSLGDLWAGSNGMKCEVCQGRTFMLFLSDAEVARLAEVDSATRNLRICQEKLGRILCENHSPKFKRWEDPRGKDSEQRSENDTDEMVG